MVVPSLEDANTGSTSHASRDSWAVCCRPGRRWSLSQQFTQGCPSVLNDGDASKLEWLRPCRRWGLGPAYLRESLEEPTWTRSTTCQACDSTSSTCWSTCQMIEGMDTAWMCDGDEMTMRLCRVVGLNLDVSWSGCCCWLLASSGLLGLWLSRSRPPLLTTTTQGTSLPKNVILPKTPDWAFSDSYLLFQC